MHQGRGLFLNGLHEMRMTMAQQIDGNTAGEIHITLTTFADQVAALASDRTHIAPRISGHERPDRHGFAFLCWPFESKQNGGHVRTAHYPERNIHVSRPFLTLLALWLTVLVCPLLTSARG